MGIGLKSQGTAHGRDRNSKFSILNFKRETEDGGEEEEVEGRKVKGPTLNEEGGQECPPSPCRRNSVPNHGLGLGSRLATLDEDGLLGFQAEDFIGDGDKILHPLGKSRFQSAEPKLCYLCFLL